MPVISILPNGMTAGAGAGGTIDQNRRKRTACKGWTTNTARRNDMFLKSVRFEDLDGTPLALTLTMPATVTCPVAGDGFVIPSMVEEQPVSVVVSSEDYHTMLDTFLKRLKRLGMTRFHWVIEMTRRKTPHIHMSAWFDLTRSSRDTVSVMIAVRNAWQEVTAGQGISISQSAQCVKKMDTVGWLQYASKHGSRGVHHYQRSTETMPESWADRPGRMWGHSSGGWASSEERKPVKLECDMARYWQLRRLVRSWCIANARKTKNSELRARYIRQARTMLKCADAKLSAVRGISTWSPEEVTWSFCALLGIDVIHYTPTEVMTMMERWVISWDIRRLIEIKRHSSGKVPLE